MSAFWPEPSRSGVEIYPDPSFAAKGRANKSYRKVPAFFGVLIPALVFSLESY